MLEHVVVVTDSLTIDGGSAEVALSSARSLARSGLSVTVFSAAGEASRDLTTCENLRVVTTNQGYALDSSNRLAGALQGVWNIRARAAMKALLATLDPERTVVHVHGWTKALSSSVVSVAIQKKFPVVLTLHEYFTVCPTGCLYLHRDRSICTLKPMSLACVVKDCDSRSYAFKVYRVIRQVIQRYSGGIPGRITKFIVVSEFSRRILEPLLPPGRFHVVSNPVDVVREERAIAERNDTFVFLGRLSAEKGGLLLAEAAKRADVKVVFIGEGEQRDSIQRLNPYAKFTGWLDRARVTAQLRRARCLVVPSIWYETLGLAVLEAAALGIPSVVPDGTAVRDLVIPGTSGLTFERGNADDLAAQLVALRDDHLVERLSRAAYDAFWSKPPSMATHLNSLMYTYQSLLDAAIPVGTAPLQMRECAR